MIWPWYKDPTFLDSDKRNAYAALLEYDPEQVVVGITQTYRRAGLGSLRRRAVAPLKRLLERHRQSRQPEMMEQFAEAYQSINPHPSSQAAREALHSNV